MPHGSLLEIHEASDRKWISWCFKSGCVLASFFLLMCQFALVKNDGHHCQQLVANGRRKLDSVEELVNGFERKQRASWGGEKWKSGRFHILLSLEYPPGNTCSESVSAVAGKPISAVDKLILSVLLYMIFTSNIWHLNDIWKIFTVWLYIPPFEKQQMSDYTLFFFFFFWCTEVTKCWFLHYSLAH